MALRSLANQHKNQLIAEFPSLYSPSIPNLETNISIIIFKVRVANRLLKILPALLVKQADPSPVDASYLLTRTPAGQPAPTPAGHTGQDLSNNGHPVNTTTITDLSEAKGKSSRRRKGPVEERRHDRNQKFSTDMKTMESDKSGQTTKSLEKDSSSTVDAETKIHSASKIEAVKARPEGKISSGPNNDSETKTDYLPESKSTSGSIVTDSAKKLESSIDEDTKMDTGEDTKPVSPSKS